MSAIVYAEDNTIQAVLQATVSGQYIRKSLDGLLEQADYDKLIA